MWPSARGAAFLALLLVASVDAKLAHMSFDLLNVSVASSWPNKTSDHSFGDIRAVVDVTSDSATTTAQIFWRRRDNHPIVKAVLVTDSSGKAMQLVGAPVVQSGCGVVIFQPKSGPGRYYVYYLPFSRKGDNAHLHFHWYECTDHTDACVLGGSMENAVDPCATVLDSASTATVSGLECREKFHCFTQMELMALPSEVRALEAAAIAASESPSFVAFLDTAARGKQLRSFGVADVPPALWARRISATERNVMEMDARAGQFFVFQIGLYALNGSAPGGNLTGVDVLFSPLSPSNSLATSNAAIPASAFRCFNLQGVGIDGTAFTKQYSLRAGGTGVLWVGVDIPITASSGVYHTAITVSAKTPSPSTVKMTLKLKISTPAVSDRGDSAIDELSRLRWLDSTAGNEDLVTSPYIAVAIENERVETTTRKEQRHQHQHPAEEKRRLARESRYEAHVQSRGDGIVVTCLNKRVQIGPNGLPIQITVTTPIRRRGRNSSLNTSLLARPVAFELYDSEGNLTPLTPTR
jgi:hypothetical protein